MSRISAAGAGAAAIPELNRILLIRPCAARAAAVRAAARLAIGGKVIECPSPLNVLKDTYA
jgi:hypothetical protein